MQRGRGERVGKTGPKGNAPELAGARRRAASTVDGRVVGGGLGGALWPRRGKRRGEWGAREARRDRERGHDERREE